VIDHGLEFDGPRHEAQGRYQLLGELLAERPDIAGWVLVGAPGSGKSTVLQHHELSTANAALQVLATHAPTSGAKRSDLGLMPEVCIWHRLSEYDAEKSPPPAEWLCLSTRWPSDLPPLDALRRIARVRFLLDGLNEIKAPNRQAQLQAVDRWTEWAAAEAARGAGLAPIFSVRALDQSPMSTSGFEVRQIVLAPWEPAQIEAYCETRLGEGNALWTTIETDAQLLELSQLPFNLWAQCELFRVLGRAARDRAELMGGMFWQMLSRRINDPPLRPPGLLGPADRQLIASGKWKQTLRALPDREGCLVPWLDDTLQRLHRRGRQVSMAQSELLAGLPPCPGAATPEQWLYAVRSLQLVDEGGHDEFTAEPLLRCTHQLWQEFFAARGIRDWAASQLERLPDLRAPALPDLDQTLARLGLREPLPGPDPTHWEESVKIAVQLVKDPAPWIAVLQQRNLALAGRAAVACGARLDGQTLNGLRQALLEASRDPGTDLRQRIEAGLVLGQLGDPRLEERQGPHGRYLWPRHWARMPAGTYRVGDNDSPVDSEKPETAVELAAFEMAFAPVTNAEYRCFIEAGGYQDERWWPGDTARRWLREGVRNEADIERWRFEFAAIREDAEAWISVQSELTESWRERVYEWAQQSESEHERLLDSWYGAQCREVPRDWDNPRFNAPTQPVMGICLFEAMAYARWLHAQCGRPVRLPVEAEWEAAARGRERRRWPWGEAAPERCHMNAEPARLRCTSPVGVFVQGDTPDGLTDLAGNLWHWTTSAYTKGLVASALITSAPDGLARRAVRGGSWDVPTVACRPSRREGDAPVARFNYLGFRLVSSCPDLGP
jgi:formylglycine-generating enzyme required for sulfatase activity